MAEMKKDRRRVCLRCEKMTAIVLSSTEKAMELKKSMMRNPTAPTRCRLARNARTWFARLSAYPGTSSSRLRAMTWISASSWTKWDSPTRMMANNGTMERRV